jgi:hypothetical protein
MSEHGKDPAERNMLTSSKQQTSASTVSERSDWIGQQLRRVYDEAVNEPIPDRLKALLEKLQDDEGKGSKS